MTRKRVRDEPSRDELNDEIARTTAPAEPAGPAPAGEPVESPETGANAGVTVPGADPAAAIAETEGEFAPVSGDPPPQLHDGTAADAVEGQRLQAAAQ